VSYRTRQRKRVIKRHRQSENTRARHYLIDATKPGRCHDCAIKFKTGAEIVYRHTPLELLHIECAVRRGIEYRPSIRWERAHEKKRSKVKRMRPSSYTPQELLAELVLVAGKTPKGGYTKSLLRRWGVGWPPPKAWPRDLVARWSRADTFATIEAELDRDLDRTLEEAA
jgi:hypothetical protein